MDERLSNCNNRKYTERLNHGCLSTTIAHSHGSIYHTIYHIQVQSCALPAALILVRVFVPVSRHGPALNLRADYYLLGATVHWIDSCRAPVTTCVWLASIAQRALYVLLCDD